MSAAQPIGVGVLGLGFMGRTHLEAYRAAARGGQANRVVAVCDRDLARFEEGASAGGNLGSADGEPLFDPETTARHTDPADLLAEPEIELVSICTHTGTHVELAMAALEAGKHVLVEKPVALYPEQVRRLADAARASDRFCMPAMCMRFWPGWDWLAQAVRAGEYGPVRSAAFRRLSARPGWSPSFYGDTTQSGGALLDLHVHDADLVRWIFGAPRSVSSRGTLDHVTTAYDLGHDGPEVSAEGLWDPSPDFAFHMGYRVEFESATAEYAFGQAAPLTLTTDGERRTIPIGPGTGYEGEVRHALAACVSGHAPGPTLEQAWALMVMLEAERESLERGLPVELPDSIRG